MDTYLQAFLKAALSGDGYPPMWATLSSGDLVTGTVGQPGQFLGGALEGLTRQYDTYAGMRGSRKEESHASAEATARQVVEPLNVTPEPDDTFVTLVLAKIFWGGRADGVDLPAVRINTESITGWWIAGGKAFKGGGGMSIGVGVIVPTDE